jgi:hypothetical protein
MFQRSVERVTANDKPICCKCSSDNNCKCKPEATQWRFVLSYCQRFKDK